MSGPGDLLDRVMQALRRDLAQRGLDQPDAWIESLDLSDGQAELQLRAPSCHGGDGLMEVAFHALKRQLPDTDIFIRRS